MRLSLEGDNAMAPVMLNNTIICCQLLLVSSELFYRSDVCQFDTIEVIVATALCSDVSPSRRDSVQRPHTQLSAVLKSPNPGLSSSRS